MTSTFINLVAQEEGQGASFQDIQDEFQIIIEHLLEISVSSLLEIRRIIKRIILFYSKIKANVL